MSQQKKLLLCRSALCSSILQTEHELNIQANKEPTDHKCNRIVRSSFFLSRFRRSQGGQALPLPAISGDFEKPVARDNPPTLALHNCIKKENHPNNLTLDGPGQILKTTRRHCN